MSAYKNPLAPAKRERVPTYNMTQAQLDAVREEGFRTGISTGMYYTNGMLSAAWLLQLRDTYGFGQKRLQRVFGRVQENFNSIVAGLISYNDMGKVLMDECRIRLTVEKPDGVREDMWEIFRQMELPKLRMEGGKVRL